MIKVKKFGFVTVLIIFTLTGLTLPALAESSSAQSAITSAENTLVNCYQAVKDAESAGANVDLLMVTLNDAAQLLTKAQLAYASNDDSAAYGYASQSQSRLSDFIAQADTLKKTAMASNTQNSVFMVFLLVIAASISCAGVIAIIALNKKQRRF